MALIDLLEVSKQYDTNKILCEVNFSIEELERVCIIGKNGSGKSTLMKIITGEIEIDGGERISKNGINIKMLLQVPKFADGLSVKDAIENELSELKEIKKSFDEVSLKLSSDYENKELLKKQAELTTKLDFFNAWDLDNEIERVLNEFMLKEFEAKPVNLLSGGEQKRVALAGLLLKKPDILLLDEPTNHLDVYMVEFLEEMLSKNRFTLIFVSHDRYFIDNVATKSVEVEECKLRTFKGGYNNYLIEKEKILSNMQKDHENLLRMLKAEEHWYQRGVTARRKRNEGRKARLLEIRESAKKNPSLIKKMSIELKREKHNFQNDKENRLNRKKMLFEIENLKKSLGEKLLIENFTTRILQQDKIAIVGKNGSGKSTFIRLLLGDLKPDKGIIKMGDFKIGYFDQHRTILNDDKNLIETFCPDGGDRVEAWGKNMHVFGYLKNFLFPKEYLDKKIGMLSGGEKNRVALALLFTKKVDCLILDEPTNDLDIPTINILEENLQKFMGAVIFVSHDRYFVDKIADRLFIFKGDGEIEESHQSYTEYLEIEKEIKEIESFSFEMQKSSNQEIKKEKKQTKLSYKDQREYELLPTKIEKYELKIKELNECLANPNCYQERGISKVADELEQLKTEYDILVERYLELEEMIEMIEEKNI